MRHASSGNLVMNLAYAARDVSPVWGRLGLGALAIFALYAPIFPQLATEWATFPNLSHGFAIPFIAAYILWVGREHITRAATAPSWAGLPVLVLGLAVYVAGSLGGEPFLARISLPVTLLGAALFLVGPAPTRRLLPGIAYLFFMIPLPYITLQSLTDQMRIFDASLSAAFLPLLGVPVFQDGYLLHLPRITLEVADVCSSIPAISALLATGAAYAWVSWRPPAIRVMLVLSAVPLGIASNIVRIVLTAAGTYYIGPIVLQSFLHAFSGTTVFLMTLVALLVVDKLLYRLYRRWTRR